MKKIIVSLLALTLTVGAFAQTTEKDASKPKKEWKQNGKERAAKLNLTDQQKQQMKSMNSDFRSKMEALKNDQSLSDDARKQKRMELAKAHRSQVEGILTPEQKEQWKSSMKTRGHKAMKDKQPMAGRRDMKNRKGGFDKMAKNLDLTADQSTKLKKINEDFKQNAMAIRSNDKLSDDQKKEQMKTLHQQHRQAFESTLTAEQREKIKSNMKSRRDRSSKEITK